MENTLENKAQFFAQYWGQKLLAVTVNENDFRQKIGNTYMGKYHVEMCHLELKPLSLITDEDARELGYTSQYMTERDADFGMSSSAIFLNEIKDFPYIDPDLDSSDADFLRSKGYALRWNGNTVEEMIDFGWIKLKK